jgi:hypothetical protein
LQAWFCPQAFPAVNGTMGYVIFCQDWLDDVNGANTCATLSTALCQCSYLLNTTNGPEGDPTPCPVELSMFTAVYFDNAPTLQWSTESESENVGWNVYRGETDDALANGTAKQINESLVPGAMTCLTRTDYSFTDEHDVQVSHTYWYWLENVDVEGETETYDPVSLTIPSANGNVIPPIPSFTGLKQNYPNPFNPVTELVFQVDKVANCELAVYNIKGECIRTLFNGRVSATNAYSVTWDGKDDAGTAVSSGVYFAILKTDGPSYTRKMMLMK